MGELCDKAVDKFFKEKKYLSLGVGEGNKTSSSRNGSNNAGYFGLWNSPRDTKNTVRGGGLTSSWASRSTKLPDSGGQLCSHQGPNHYAQ